MQTHHMMNRILKITHRLRWFVFFCLLAAFVFCKLLDAKQKGPGSIRQKTRMGSRPIYFDVKDVGKPTDKVHVIEPWKIISLDPEYGGQWVVAGDVDGDSEVEIVSAENVNKNDVHYTSTAVAQKLDGSVLWRWGNPAIGRKKWHHDVACQIHDWDGDGKNEVVLCTKGYLVELDGANGQERRRIAIADEATDCLLFCNLTGGNRPIDLDGDGRDEIMAGYAMLNPDGSVRWVFQSKKVEQARGHLDCCRVVRRGETPEDFRLALTCCGANNIALVDGEGKVLWEVSGHHFESVDVGQIIPKHRAAQFLVDIDHQPLGKSPLWVLDEEGNHLGQIITDYSRHHHLLDWTGDGVNEILVAHNGGLYNHKGERIGTFATPRPTKNGPPANESVSEKSVLTGDMTGDGVPDVVLATTEAVYIFKNEKGLKPDRPVPLGTGLNFTLY